MPPAKKPRTAASRKGGDAPALTPVPTTPEEVAANFGILRDRLVSSLTLTTERLQDTVDDAVRRGRMTRNDAEDLLAALVAAGRAQTEALVADLEQLLGRGASVRLRTADHAEAVRRTVDAARRKVAAGAAGAAGAAAAAGEKAGGKAAAKAPAAKPARRASGGMPIAGYDDLTAVEITKRLKDLTPAQLRKVRDYEAGHGKRKSVLNAVERKLG